MAKRLVGYMKSKGLKFKKGNASKFDKNGEKIIVNIKSEDNEGNMVET